MQRFYVIPQEWKIAHKYLDDKENGTKLPSSMQYNNQGELKYRWSNIHGRDFRRYRTTHSFIKINNVIYALEPGKTDGILGKGTFGKVKMGMGEDNRFYAIKIIQIGRYRPSEYEILDDLDLCHGQTPLVRDLSFPISVHPQLKEKMYMVMPYLGIRLKEWLLTKQDEARLDLAIRLCWRLFQLHQGHGSKTQKTYAHLDIKPENIRVDAFTNDITLVDYGLSRVNAKGKRLTHRCTKHYSIQRNADGFVRATGIQHDMIALKRTLFMPAFIHCAKDFLIMRSYIDNSDSAFPSVLSRYFIIQNHLMPYVDTGSVSKNQPYHFEEDTMTADQLCALLTAVKLELTIPFEQILACKMTTLIIASADYYGFSKNQVVSMLEWNPTLLRIFAAFIQLNKLNKFNHYLSNSEFMTRANNMNEFVGVCALIQLYEHDMSTLQLSQCTVVSEAILALCNDGMSGRIASVANDPDLARVIMNLEEWGLERLYERAISASREYPFALQYAFLHLNSPMVAHVLSLLENISGYTDEQLVKVCENEDFCRAIKLLNEKNCSQMNIKKIIQDDELSGVVMFLVDNDKPASGRDVCKMVEAVTINEMLKAAISRCLLSEDTYIPKALFKLIDFPTYSSCIVYLMDSNNSGLVSSLLFYLEKSAILWKLAPYASDISAALVAVQLAHFDLEKIANHLILLNANERKSLFRELAVAENKEQLLRIYSGHYTHSIYRNALVQGHTALNTPRVDPLQTVIQSMIQKMGNKS